MTGLLPGSREDDPDAAVRAFGESIARLIALAVELNRVPVIPGLPCDAPWITRRDGARFGIKVRSIQTFFTHRSVSTFDRVPFN